MNNYIKNIKDEELNLKENLIKINTKLYFSNNQS